MTTRIPCRPELQKILKNAGVSANMGYQAMVMRLNAYKREVVMNPEMPTQEMIYVMSGIDEALNLAWDMEYRMQYIPKYVPEWAAD